MYTIFLIQYLVGLKNKDRSHWESNPDRMIQSHQS